MIEIKEVKLTSNKNKKEAFSYSFDKGQINYLNYCDKFIFDLLTFKNQSIESGTILINETEVFPNQEDINTFFIIRINSLVKLFLCFVVTKEEKDEKLKNIQENLIKLRELPSVSDFEKNAKIAAIFDEIVTFLPSYILIDSNEQDEQFVPTLDQQINKLFFDIPVLVLNKKPTQITNDGKQVEYDEIIDISIGAETTSKVVKVQKIDDEFILFEDDNEKLYKKVINVFKENAMVFFSFLIPLMGVVGFLLLTPPYLKTENKFLAIPFIITIIICFVLYMLMTYKCTAFMLDFKANKQKSAIFFFINSFVALIGGGLGVVIYVLFKNFDTSLKGLGNNTLGIVLALIAFLIMLTANLYIRIVVDKIISLFKKKK